MKKSVSRLKDVAIAAQVSVGAASRILRGDTGPFKAETIDRVVESAKNLGWRRNLLVSGMQTGQTQTVGVLVPPYDSFWIGVLAGIHDRLSAVDFLPITIWIGGLDKTARFEDNDQIGLDAINRLLDRRVQALIAWPQIACAYRHCFEQVAKKNVPIVVIDLYEDNPLGDAVLTTEKSSSYLVAEHLLELGHRRFGCFSTERESKAHSWAVMREQYFREAVAKVPGTEVQTVKRNATNNGYQAVYSLLNQPNRPTAVFALTDHLAATVYQVAAELGIRIPHELSVVGFSDLDFASKLAPPLTTLHQQPKAIGEQAAQFVLDRVLGNKTLASFRRHEVDGWLVKRASTAPPHDIG